MLGLLCLAFCLPGASQQPGSSQADATLQQPDTAEGLRLLLEDLLAAAKKSDEPKIRALLKQTEIPNALQWFYSTFPADKAGSWTGGYEQNLAANENAMQELINELVSGQGQLVVRKINEQPPPGQVADWSMLRSARTALEVYFASWDLSPTGSGSIPIGYFLYIDGAFRWDSLIHPITIAKAGVEDPSTASPAGPEKPLSGPLVSPGSSVRGPRPLSTTSPLYTKEARQEKIEGTVLLSLVVDIDGSGKKITVLRGLGHGLDEKAVESVRKWRFKPATKDGVPVPTQINVEVNFQLY